jgi:hypothetical protein
LRFGESLAVGDYVLLVFERGQRIESGPISRYTRGSTGSTTYDLLGLDFPCC